jgi:hypothetical protein
MTRVTITVPDMCQLHQRLLVDQVGVGPGGPWRAYIIVAQVALFQAATAHPTTYNRIGGDVSRISELGCLACDRPDAFGEIIAAFQAGGVAAVKAWGDAVVQNGAKP